MIMLYTAQYDKHDMRHKGQTATVSKIFSETTSVTLTEIK